MLKRWIAPTLLAGAFMASAFTASAASLPLASPDVAAAGVAPAAGVALVKVTTNPGVGTILTDGSSRTLYLFMRDEQKKSNCTGACLTTWPPLLSEGAPQAGPGVNVPSLGAIKRDDGTSQVTYNGWPLYYFAQDKALSDAKGQNSGNLWFVVSPYGGPRENAATVKVTNDILTDPSGRTLYMYTRDTPGVTNCFGNCAIVWPPALTIGIPKAEGGANGPMVNMIRREEGSTQLTYNDWPLYYYHKDVKPGDIKGQDVGGVWFALSSSGEILKTLPASAAKAAPAASATAAPAALPRTGDNFGAVMAGLAAAGVALLAVGRLLRRSTT